MNPEHRIPETFVANPERARDQALAEKPFRDKALELSEQAKTTEVPSEQTELEAQVAFLNVQANEQSKTIARQQALRPVEGADIPLSDDIEGTLAHMKDKFEHPVDNETIKKYEALGLPRAILEASNSRPFDELVDVRKNRISVYRMWRAEGALEDTLHDDTLRLEDLEERRKLGQYDEDFPSDLRLKDAIANTLWNIALCEEVLREEPIPNEEKFGKRLKEISELFANQLQINSALNTLSWKYYNNPEMRNRIEALSSEWRAIENERSTQSYRIDWPQEFVDRVRSAHDRILKLSEE